MRLSLVVRFVDDTDLNVVVAVGLFGFGALFIYHDLLENAIASADSPVETNRSGKLCGEDCDHDGHHVFHHGVCGLDLIREFIRAAFFGHLGHELHLEELESANHEREYDEAFFKEVESEEMGIHVIEGES